MAPEARMMTLLSFTDMNPPRWGNAHRRRGVDLHVVRRQLRQQRGVVGEDADVALDRAGEDERRLAGEQLPVQRDDLHLHSRLEVLEIRGLAVDGPAFHQREILLTDVERAAQDVEDMAEHPGATGTLIA